MEAVTQANTKQKLDVANVQLVDIVPTEMPFNRVPQGHIAKPVVYPTSLVRLEHTALGHI